MVAKAMNSNVFGFDGSNHMNMRCADTGRLMWQSDEWYVQAVEKPTMGELTLLFASFFNRGEDIYRVEQKGIYPALC